jgi:hypothetical protein
LSALLSDLYRGRSREEKKRRGGDQRRGEGERGEENFFLFAGFGRTGGGKAFFCGNTSVATGKNGKKTGFFVPRVRP